MNTSPSHKTGTAAPPFVLPGKSWVFVNPRYGCPVGCVYCMGLKDPWFSGKIGQLVATDDVFAELDDHSLILPHKTPIAFFNLSDPFLPDNASALLRILWSMERARWHNKVGIITKIHPGIKHLESLAELCRVRPILLVSFACMHESFDSPMASRKQRLRLLRDARSVGLPVVVYLRPLVREWLDVRRLKELCEHLRESVAAVSLSGLRLTPAIARNIQSKGLPIPVARDYVSKNRDDQLTAEVGAMVTEKAGIPWFVHTSCAVSFVFREPDYNSHDIREAENGECPFPCVLEQKRRCGARRSLTPDRAISDLISRLGKRASFARRGNSLILFGPDLTREDVSFVRHLVAEHVRLDK